MLRLGRLFLPLLLAAPTLAPASVDVARQALERGKLARQGGDLEGARAALEEAVRAAPTWIFPHLELAELAVLQRLPSEALADALVRMQPDGEGIPRYHRLMGEMADLRGDDAAAAAAWGRSLALDPAQAELRGRRAAVLALIERLEEAIDEYARALIALPLDLALRARFADTLEQSGRHQEAREQLERLVAQQPGKEIPLRRLARFHERQGDLRAAKETHAKADRLRARAPVRQLRPLPPSRR